MQKNAASQSGIFNPRVLLAFTLCSVGALLAMFSLAATPPVETTHAKTSVPQPAASESMPLVSGAQSNDWSIVSSPNTSATENNALRGVTCVSASECWAVGYYLADNAAQTLIERWDGTSWSIVSSPNTSATQSNFLLGVTCASASECWAVGYYYNDNVISQTLIERWNGTSWEIVSSPNTSTKDYNALSGVTCVSASECWAVVCSVGVLCLCLRVLLR
jgi:hypothetical protein